MDEYLTEDDQLQMVKRWLKENILWIVAGLGLGAALLFGWRWWQERITARAHAASAQYSQMLTALERGDQASAFAVAGRLRQDYSDTPYADQADLTFARVEVERNELDKAAGRLRAVMEGSDDEQLRQVARLRLARVLLAQNKPDEALATLAKTEADAFAPQYSEVRGDVLLAKGDRSGALAAYREALKPGEPGGAGQSQLQLKIDDLSAAAPAEPAKQPNSQEPKP